MIYISAVKRQTQHAHSQPELFCYENFLTRFHRSNAAPCNFAVVRLAQFPIADSTRGGGQCDRHHQHGMLHHRLSGFSCRDIDMLRVDCQKLCQVSSRTRIIILLCIILTS